VATSWVGYAGSEPERAERAIERPAEHERPLRVWPLRARGLAVLVAAYVAITALWTAAGLLVVNVIHDTALGERETSLSTWLEAHRTPGLDTWSEYGSLLSDTRTKLIAVPLLSALFVYLWRRWHDAVFLATVMLLEVSIFGTTAYLVGRDRPPVEQLDGSLPTNSFPSGHVAAAVAFYCGLFVIARWHTRRRAVLIPLGVLAFLAPLAVLTSRLYRGMHYLSDVMFGVGLGAASLVATYLALRAGLRKLAERRDLPRNLTQLDCTAVDREGALA
jgi:membrane-associated phospholipid phosphatase